MFQEPTLLPSIAQHTLNVCWVLGALQKLSLYSSKQSYKAGISPFYITSPTLQIGEVEAQRNWVYLNSKPGLLITLPFCVSCCEPQRRQQLPRHGHSGCHKAHGPDLLGRPACLRQTRWGGKTLRLKAWSPDLGSTLCPCQPQISHLYKEDSSSCFKLGVIMKIMKISE